ncbi:MAG: Y-family DNA polymerase, partial [bacterium]|nr:Y-family DNA polymerase [bacterium]
MKKLFALVDCNSFFCSCEQVFAPQLLKKPVVVLSNNDGVIVARSAEAKLAGIKMGEPYHQAKEKIRNKNVHVFSSNYSLYGDMSDRVMLILQQLGLEVEIYSIDEAFLSYELVPKANRKTFAENIRSKILKATGIPVSVGIGPTKVLAKVANEIAKKSISNICDLSSGEDYNAALATFPIEDIWGVGRKSAVKLREHGINTAKDLQETDLDKIEKLLTVTGRRIALELNGISCLDLDVSFVPRKQIISSKSFGKKVFTITELSEACSSYLTKACEKLRSQNSVCGEVKV